MADKNVTFHPYTAQGTMDTETNLYPMTKAENVIGLPEGGGIEQNEVVDRRATLPQATASSADFVEVGSVLYAKTKYIAWDEPTITLSGDVVATPIVEGVTKYKMYANGTYIGYVDSNNTWHGEVSE